MTTDEYASLHTSQEPILLKELVRQTHLNLIHPRMLSGHLQGRFLAFIIALINPKNVLELGTFTGYSAYCLAENLPSDGHLYTIEINDEISDIAKNLFDKVPFKEKITFLVGDSFDIVPNLNVMFDFVFIDANKRHYSEYYDLIFPHIRVGGVIVADNVLWDGHVLSDETESKDTQTSGIKKFNIKIQNDSRVENVLLPLRDGLMMIRKISN